MISVCVLFSVPCPCCSVPCCPSPPWCLWKIYCFISCSKSKCLTDNVLLTRFFLNSLCLFLWISLLKLWIILGLSFWTCISLEQNPWGFPPTFTGFCLSYVRLLQVITFCRITVFLSHPLIPNTLLAPYTCLSYLIRNSIPNLKGKTPVMFISLLIPL